jgi:glycosyltransferase involved in cell wall biosynthesis
MFRALGRQAAGSVRRIRQLHVITGLQTGGAEMMLYNLIAGIDRSRFDPSVICLGDSGIPGSRIRALGIPVYVAGMSPTCPSPTVLLRICRWVRHVRPDLIQGWMYHGNAAASLTQCVFFRSVPVLWAVHHAVYRLKDEKPRTATLIRLSARASRRTRRIIYVSRESADQHEALGFAPERTTVIPNGFDCDLFAPSRRARSAVRRQLNVSQDAVLIGLIGRFHPMKDHASFFQAACIASKSDPAIQFVLAGKGIHWMNADVVALVNRFQLNGRVHLLGERDDIPQVTAALDIATSSSFSESFPLVVGEAMACGVPCVVTDVGDSAAVVGATGSSVPPRDPAALAAAWLHLVQAGVAVRSNLGVAARQRILESFSLSHVVRRYEATYHEVLRNGTGEACA